jgi:predicted small lipoprotein YifL
MKHIAQVALAIAAVAGLCAGCGDRGGQVWTPPSSVQQPGDTGNRAHTNVEVFTPPPGTVPPPPPPNSTSGGHSQ